MVQRDRNKSPQHISAGQKTMRQVKHRRQPQVNVIQVSTRMRAHQERDGKIQGERRWQCRKSRKVTAWIMFGKPWRDFPADTITCFKKWSHCFSFFFCCFSFIDLLQLLSFLFQISISESYTWWPQELWRHNEDGYTPGIRSSMRHTGHTALLMKSCGEKKNGPAPSISEHFQSCSIQKQW